MMLRGLTSNARIATELVGKRVDRLPDATVVESRVLCRQLVDLDDVTSAVVLAVVENSVLHVPPCGPNTIDVVVVIVAVEAAAAGVVVVASATTTVHSHLRSWLRPSFWPVDSVETALNTCYARPTYMRAFPSPDDQGEPSIRGDCRRQAAHRDQQE